MNSALTRMLATYNQFRLQPGSELQPHPHEIAYVEDLRSQVKEMVPANAPYSWYESLTKLGPGQNDPLHIFLAEQATKEQMIWFLSQEAAGEAGFDDLVAMTQVKMPVQAKLEMARNYWDEMGRGDEWGMHGRLLEGVIKYFEIKPSNETTVDESLQLANLMTAMAVHRRYAYHSVGALGAIEMTAPGRVSLVDRGLERLGVPSDARRYFTLHAALDIKHSREWNREVIEPLWPIAGQAIAEGAYLRLWAGLLTYRRYRAELGI